MSNKFDFKHIASLLTGGEPMAFKAFPDGSLVVIAHDGKKHRFTAEQVAEVQTKTVPEADPKPKRGRPANTVAKSKKAG